MSPFLEEDPRREAVLMENSKERLAGGCSKTACIHTHGHQHWVLSLSLSLPIALAFFLCTTEMMTRWGFYQNQGEHTCSLTKRSGIACLSEDVGCGSQRNTLSMTPDIQKLSHNVTVFFLLLLFLYHSLSSSNILYFQHIQLNGDFQMCQYLSHSSRHLNSNMQNNPP